MLAFTDLDGNRCRMFFTPDPRIESNRMVKTITEVYVHKAGSEYIEVDLQTVNLEAELQSVFAGSRFLDMPEMHRMAMDLSAFSEVLGHDNVEAIYFCY